MSIATKLVIGLLTAGLMGSVSAQEVISMKKASDFAKNSKLTQGKDVLVIKGTSCFVTSKNYTLDPSKKYKLSGDIRCAAGKPVTALIGLAPYAANNRAIGAPAVYSVNKSFTVVAVAAKKGDKVIKVKDASGWNFTNRYSHIAFGAKADLSDLPNFNTLSTVVPNAKRNGNVWDVILNAPLKKDVAAGTSVRQHFSGSSYIYTIATKATPQWTTRKGVISGVAKHGVPGNKLWAGTKTVKGLILLLNGDKDSVTEIRNLKLEVVK